MSSTYEGGTVTFLLSVGLRDPKAAQAWTSQQSQWELQRQGDRLADAPHPDGPPAGGKGGCGKVPSPGTASTGDAAAGQHGTGRCGLETGGGRLLRPDLHGPVLLTRSRSCCHLLRWLGLGHDPHFAFGRLSMAMRSISSRGRVHLLSLMPWQQATLSWTHVHRQHDAAEFMQFLLGYSQPVAFCGRWEARISRDDSSQGFELRDSGGCFAPIVVDISGGSLQHCIYHWHIHGQLHALCSPPTFLFLQLKRFNRGDSGVCKDVTPVDIEAGSMVRFPCFHNSNDLSTYIVNYEVRGVIFHVGLELLTGHYRAALSSHEPSAPDGGVFLLTDDNRLASRVDSRNDSVNSGGYLVGLSRST